MKKQERKRIHVRTLWFFLLVHLMFFAGVAQSDFPEQQGAEYHIPIQGTRGHLQYIWHVGIP